MFIYRDNIIIELTAEELRQAHAEQEHNSDVANIRNHFKDWQDDDFALYCTTKKEAEKAFDAIAEQISFYRSKGYPYNDAMLMAINEIL